MASLSEERQSYLPAVGWEWEWGIGLKKTNWGLFGEKEGGSCLRMNTFIQLISELRKRHIDVYRGRKSYFQRRVSFDGIKSGSPPYLSVLPSHSWVF